MKYAEIKNFDIANGPGCRVSLFVSGCRNHCLGCFNQEAQSFKYGSDYTSQTVLELLEMLGNEHSRQAKSRYPEKDIWCWTGYMWENVKDLSVINYIDVLVDGPFIQEQKDLSLAYRGSRNQRVIDVKKSFEAGCAIRLEGDWR